MKERYILTGKVQFGRQYQITDSETDYKYENNKSDKQKICDLLNKVIDENEKLKKDKKRLIGYLHRYGFVDVEDVDEIILSKEYLDEWGELYNDEW